MKKTESLTKRLGSFAERYLIFAVLTIGLGIRLVGVDFGLPFLYHPDEYPYVSQAIASLILGDMNPHSFAHPGSFITYLLVFLYGIIYLIGAVSGSFPSIMAFDQFYLNDPSRFHLIGRLLIVFFSMVTIWFVYLISKKHHNWKVGTLAALCLALSPMHITESRYIRPDVPAAMLIMISLYFLLERKPHNEIYLLISSFIAGVSIATKYTSGLMVIPIMIYCLSLESKKSIKGFFKDSFLLRTTTSRSLLFIFLGFFIFAPFVILDYKESISDIMFELTSTKLGRERLPGIQTHVWYLANGLNHGIGGIIIEFFALIGLVILIRRFSNHFIFLIFPILSFLLIGSMSLRWHRWMIPILPFEAILFGVGVFNSYLLIQSMAAVPRRAISLMISCTVILALLNTSIMDIREARKLTLLDTRTASKYWIEENLPEGSKIALEYASPPLEVRPAGNFYLINLGTDSIVSHPLDHYRNLSVDYIIVTSELKDLYYDEPSKYPIEISRYEELNRPGMLVKAFNNSDNPGPVIEIYKLD